MCCINDRWQTTVLTLCYNVLDVSTLSCNAVDGHQRNSRLNFGVECWRFRVDGIDYICIRQRETQEESGGEQEGVCVRERARERRWGGGKREGRG